jgi:hypothetical protein
MINDRLLWPQGKKKAFTLSYDDGITQDKRLIEMLDCYGAKCTFNLNTGLFGLEGRVSAGKKEVSHNKLNAEEVLQAYKKHEIAAHGQYHESMHGMDDARIIEEALSCRKQLEMLLEKPLTGFAYAFGVCNEQIIRCMKSCGYTYARTIESTYSFEYPENFLAWNPTCHHNDDKIMALAEEFLSDTHYFSFKSPAKLFYVWGHSYEFDQDGNWEHMEALLKKVSGKEDVWYATNGEIEKYVRAYNNLIFSVDSTTVYNPSAISVWIGGLFSDEIVELKPGEVSRLAEYKNM